MELEFYSCPRLAVARFLSHQLSGSALYQSGSFLMSVPEYTIKLKDGSEKGFPPVYREMLAKAVLRPAFLANTGIVCRDCEKACEVAWRDKMMWDSSDFSLSEKCHLTLCLKHQYYQPLLVYICCIYYSPLISFSHLSQPICACIVLLYILMATSRRLYRSLLSQKLYWNCHPLCY